jgi:hypothetical protein
VKWPVADESAADERAHRRDSGNDADVTREQITGVARFTLDHRPFGFRLQQYIFDAFDEIHDTPPLIHMLKFNAADLP